MKLEHETLRNAISQHYEHGISRIRLDGGRIVIFTSTGNMTRDAIDMWWNVFEQTVDAWDEDQPLLMLYDLTHPKMVITPYGRRKGAETRELLINRDQCAFVAFVVEDSFNYRLLSMLLNFFSIKTSRYRERLFRSGDSALNWLRQFGDKASC